MSTLRLPVITATGILAFVSVPHVFANDAVSKMETVVVTASMLSEMIQVAARRPDRNAACTAP